MCSWSPWSGWPARRRRARRSLQAAVVAVACAAALAACGGGPAGASHSGASHSGASHSGASHSAASHSGSSRSGSSAARGHVAGIGSDHRAGTVPLQVVHAEGETLAVAEVSIAGHGPYPFIVDTGSSTSVLDTAVAKAAGIHLERATTTVAGVGCTTKAHRAQVTRWKAGAVRLPGDRVSVLSLPGGNAIGGLLGSDVLSRFGEVALSYSGQQLELGRAAVRLGSPVARVRVTVVQHHGAVAAVVPVRVDRHGPFPFVVDTGAAKSVIATSLAHRLHLSEVGHAVHASGVACHVRASQVRVARWRVGSVALPAFTAVSISLPGSDQGQGIDGLLGSSTLSRYGTVAIAYGRHRLLLGG